MKKNKLSILASALIISAAAILTGCSQQASENTNSIKENIPGNNSPNVTIIMGKVTAVSDQTITIVLSATPDNIQQKDNSQPQNSAQKSAPQGAQTRQGTSPQNDRQQNFVPPSGGEKPASDKVNPNLSTPTPSAQIPTEFTGGEKTITLTDNTEITKGFASNAKSADKSQIAINSIISVKLQTDENNQETAVSIEIIQ